MTTLFWCLCFALAFCLFAWGSSLLRKCRYCGGRGFYVATEYSDGREATLRIRCPDSDCIAGRVAR